MGGRAIRRSLGSLPVGAMSDVTSGKQEAEQSNYI